MLTLDTSDIMKSEYRNTFVYAVPRSCLDPRLRYNPYEIVTISRVSDLTIACLLKLECMLTLRLSTRE